MADELKKISLETAEQPNGPETSGKKKNFSGKILAVPLIIIAVVLVILVTALLPLWGVYVDVQQLVQSGKDTAAAIKTQDLLKTKESLKITREKLKVLKSDYNKVLTLKLVPLLGAYISDGEHAVNAGEAALDAADQAIAALEPNADLLGLKGKSTFVSGSADDRIQMAVKTMSALTPKINQMALAVDKLRREIDAIDPNRYPEHLGKVALKSQIAGLRDTVDNAANLFVNAQPLLVNLPKLLGDPAEKRYLILFQNDKELRSTGGFITAYAQFRFAKGKAILEKADDIYSLDASLSKKSPAPIEILKFHKDVFTYNLRDSNLSPDFRLSMQAFENLYQYAAGREIIDGIWALDTHVLVEALRILGPVNVYGREFSADKDKRCDCPAAVYELEDYSTRPVNYVRTARKDVIGVLMQTLLKQALGVSPSKYWGKLFQMLITEINEKHVLAYFHDSDAQRAAESFNMAGRIMTASESATILSYQEGKDWDYLHVNNSNMAGAKSNMFVSEKVTKDVTVNGDALTTKLTVDYKNPYPGSDCGLESGGLCLNAPLRNWVRIYVPSGSKLMDSRGIISPQDGKAVPMDTYQSLGKTVFEGFLIVDPLGSAKLELTYSTPIKFADHKYQLLIQKQPGTNGAQYLIKLNGRQEKDFPLLTDTELKLQVP